MMNNAIILLGRLNPFTRGHEFLVETLQQKAKELGYRPFVFVVEGAKTSKDKAKNPLTGEQRAKFIKSLFPEITVDIVGGAYDVLDILYVQGYNLKLWIAGSDRATKYQRLLDDEGVDGCVLAVDRREGDVAHISATLAREAANKNLVREFLDMMPLRATEEKALEIMRIIQEVRNDDNSAVRAGTTLPG